MVPVRKRGRTLGSLLERFKKNPKGKHPAEESVLGRTIPPPKDALILISKPHMTKGTL
jgi:hypothetical protein